MEHFELHEKHQSSLPHLRASLADIGLSERGLKSLCIILNNHFIGIFEQCNEEGRQEDYRNRQPKPDQPQLRQNRLSQRKRREVAPRDSAVDVGIDNGDTEESVLDKLYSTKGNTPPQGTVAGDMPIHPLTPTDENLDCSGFDDFHGLDPAVFGPSYHDPLSLPLNSSEQDTGYIGGYAAQANHNGDLPGMMGNGSSGLLFDQGFQYLNTQEQVAQGHWGLGQPVLSFAEPANALNAWVHGQQGHQH